MTMLELQSQLDTLAGFITNFIQTTRQDQGGTPWSEQQSQADEAVRWLEQAIGHLEEIRKRWPNLLPVSGQWPAYPLDSLLPGPRANDEAMPSCLNDLRRMRETLSLCLSKNESHRRAFIFILLAALFRMLGVRLSARSEIYKTFAGVFRALGYRFPSSGVEALRQTMNRLVAGNPEFKQMVDQIVRPDDVQNAQE